MKTLESKLALKKLYGNGIFICETSFIVNKTLNRKHRKKKLIKSLNKVTIKKSKTYIKNYRSNSFNIDDWIGGVHYTQIYPKFDYRTVTVISNF